MPRVCLVGLRGEPKPTGNFIRQALLYKGQIGQNFRGEFELLQVILREVRSGIGWIISLTANLNHSEDPALSVEDWSGHQLLNSVLFSRVAVRLNQFHALENAGVFHLHKGIVKFCFLGGRCV